MIYDNNLKTKSTETVKLYTNTKTHTVEDDLNMI